MPADKYVEENSLVAMLAIKRLAGVASVVNLREHLTYMLPPIMNSTAHFQALKPRGDVNRSPKQGYQWSYKKD